MTADVELLPLPEPDTHDAAGYRRAYSPEAVRANVAHATAAKDAETEALRAEVGLLRRGNVAYSQQVADLIGRAGSAEARAERLAEALRKAREDINWMLNSRQFLNSFVFDYIDAALDQEPAHD